MPAERKCSGTLCIPIAYGQKKNLHHNGGDAFLGTPISPLLQIELGFGDGTFVSPLP